MAHYADMVSHWSFRNTRHYYAPKRKDAGIFGMVRMKRAQLQWTTITWIIAGAFLVFLIVVFSPLMKKAISYYEFEFSSTKIERIEEQEIDEERIDANIKIKIEALPPEIDKESGHKYIIKNEYGRKWSLIHYEEILYGDEGDPFLSNPDIVVDISEQNLATILSSDKVRGVITIHGKKYVHTNAENEFKRFEDVDMDSKYSSGKDKDITVDELAQLKLTELWEEAIG